VADTSRSLLDRLQPLFEGRPRWINTLMVFCFFMTFIYMPWDLFIKPAKIDQEVWLGIMFTGWAAKVAGVPHWAVYAAGAYGFWRMRPWMWPWAAVYSGQVAVGMLVWSLLELDGSRAWLFGVGSFAPFAVLTWALWRARPRFQTTS
jgi:hypothetical protein